MFSESDPFLDASVRKFLDQIPLLDIVKKSVFTLEKLPNVYDDALRRLFYT